MPRAMKRYDEAKRIADARRKAEYEAKKAESRQFVADRKAAKALLEAHGEDLARYAYVHWHGEKEPTLSIALARKRLRSVAWFDPALVIKLFEKMEGRG